MQQSLTFAGGLPIDYPTDGSMCKSLSLQSMLVAWRCGLLDWRTYPIGIAPELPTAPVWSWSGWWPSAFIDDSATNPPGADLAIPPASFNSGVQQSFGPSVQAASAHARDATQRG